MTAKAFSLSPPPCLNHDHVASSDEAMSTPFYCHPAQTNTTSTQALAIDFLRFKKGWDTVRVSPVEITSAMDVTLHNFASTKGPSLVQQLCDVASSLGRGDSRKTCLFTT